MSGTVLELLRRPPAEVQAGRQYAQAIERLFDQAHRLVTVGRPDDAEDAARLAVRLRMDARREVRVP